MKKQVIFSIAALLAVLTLVIVRITIGYDIEWKGTIDDEYYGKRVRAEWKMQENADKDALETFRQLEKTPGDRQHCIEEVTACLQYALDHFDELEKGQAADIQVTSKLSYAHSYISTLYNNSDYDQKVHTAKEKRFWKCLVNRYAHVFRGYAESAAANFQEKADLLKIEQLSKQLSKNLDEEVESFVNRLVAVIEEGKK